MAKRTCTIEGCDRPHMARGWCGAHWKRWKNHGDPLHGAPTIRHWRSPELLRFWEKVDKRGPLECWPWLGRTDEKGYGLFTTALDQERRAHRFAYQTATGIDPGNLLVCHHCDNPPCVNPAHLFLGTNQDNMADMVAKGRQARMQGEQHPNRVLTSEQVLEIRRLRSQGWKVVQLATRFSTAPTNISSICTGKTWSHLS